jgi:hypothetical protein
LLVIVKMDLFYYIKQYLKSVFQYKPRNRVDQKKLDNTTQPLVHNNIKEVEFMYQKVNTTMPLW